MDDFSLGEAGAEGFTILIAGGSDVVPLLSPPFLLEPTSAGGIGGIGFGGSWGAGVGAGFGLSFFSVPIQIPPSMQLSTQQQLVLEQMQRLYDNEERTGEHLDNKAMAILQTGSLIVALASVTVLSNISQISRSAWTVSASIFGFVLFGSMVLLSLSAMKPREHKTVGTPDWIYMHANYINKEPNEAYTQLLANLVEATKANGKANKHKAKLVERATWSVVFLVAEILVLAIVWVWFS